MLPFFIFLLALALRQSAGDALRAGVKIGVGFVGIGLVIGLLAGQRGPAAQAMVENFGLDLSVIDVGWPSTAAIAFGSTVGAFAIPIGLAVNVVILATASRRPSTSICGTTGTSPSPARSWPSSRTARPRVSRRPPST